LRVLGIDPGSRYLGYGVVEQRGRALVHVGHGVVKAGSEAPLEQRLKIIFAELTQVISLFQPDAVAVEGVFTFRNARSALILGHARGVALLVAAQLGLPVFEYPPARVKKSVGAGGNDGKEAVARMVHAFLCLPKDAAMRSDAFDALAVAICHCNQARAPLPARRSKGSFAQLAGRLTPSVIRASP
jgi:crossover junction endodeoxyribonuclease RuvC